MTKTYTFDVTLVSDLHKDAYGFRPSQSFWGFFAAANADQKQAVWDDLLKALEATVARERANEARAIERFERLVFELFNTGAKSFDMAIAWLHQAHDTDGDDDYLEFKLGLPFGYIARARHEQSIEDPQVWAEQSADLDAVAYAH